MRVDKLVATGILAAFVLAACGSSAASPSASPSMSPSTGTPSVEPSASDVASPSLLPSASPATAGTTYTVKKGDTLWGIASKNKIKLDALIAANPQLKDPNKLKVGEILTIPTTP